MNAPATATPNALDAAIAAIEQATAQPSSRMTELMAKGGGLSAAERNELGDLLKSQASSGLSGPMTPEGQPLVKSQVDASQYIAGLHKGFQESAVKMDEALTKSQAHNQNIAVALATGIKALLTLQKSQTAEIAGMRAELKALGDQSQGPRSQQPGSAEPGALPGGAQPLAKGGAGNQAPNMNDPLVKAQQKALIVGALTTLQEQGKLTPNTIAKYEAADQIDPTTLEMATNLIKSQAGAKK